MVKKQHGVIAILDALGIKGIWQKQDPQKTVETWDDLMKIYQTVQEKRTKETDGYKSTFRAFSDTIIITAIGYDITETLVKFGVDLGILFTHSALKGFFLRGCVSVGDFYLGEKMIIGPSIDEAAQYHILPQWVGISASPSVHSILRKEKSKHLLDFGYGHTYLPYKIPTKLGIEDGFAINLPLAYSSTYNTFRNDLQLEVPDTLEEILGKELDKISDIEASFKIRNTLNFIKHANSINRKYSRDHGN